ncbi:MAG: amidohydrolase family protein, partial [Flavobacteriales bacterium]|nr:amidohydrolase family protein [Flavobacteriales bacterium]
MRGLLSFLACSWCLWTTAQVNAPVNGPATKTGRYTAFIHATVHPEPTVVLRDATVLVLDDRIVAVGERVPVPAGAVVRDLTGSHIWPALIEPYSDLGMPETPRDRVEKSAGARFWNPAIRASTRADELFRAEEEQLDRLRAQGFATVITHRKDGIARGTSCAVALAGRSINADILVPKASAHFSFRKGSSKEDYPSSLTGSIALLRQALYDARWLATAGKGTQSDAELEALNDQLALPLVFEAGGRNDVLRAKTIAREFGLRFIIKGQGDEYARLADILADEQALILPMEMPEAYAVEDPFDALETSLAKLKHWELAPTNAARIAEAGGTFAFTTHGLKDLDRLWGSLRRMVRCGLDSSAAIAALTTVPATYFGMEHAVGSLKAGCYANLLITSHHLLHPKNIIHETWAAGERFVQHQLPGEDPRGTFELNLQGKLLRLKVSGEVDHPKASIALPGDDSTSVNASLERDGESVTLHFLGERVGVPGRVRLNGAIHPRGAIWDGQGLVNDSWITWSAVRRGAAADPARKERAEETDSTWVAPSGTVWYPMGAYGVPMLPDTEVVLFRNATVWTNGPDGVLPDADVLIADGRIRAVGKGLSVDRVFEGRRRPTITEVDARGMHLTSGIIDEHSHIAIDRGVNEGSQAITAEVRMADVIDPDDVDIYRNLAGGVVAIQQLHGSANPIGGQSSLIKLRWGQPAERMRIAGAPGFIKFALGENVKQSNWNTDGTRFPQTRMGVEQLMYD